MSESAIRLKYGAEGITGYVEYGDGTGAITDDTQMTLFTAEGLLRAAVRGKGKGICAPEEVMRYAYLRWLKTQGIEVACQQGMLSGWLIRQTALWERRAPGNTCLSALEHSTRARRAANNSKGCGTVMRMAPVGLFLEPEAAYEKGCLFSALTHGHPTGITAGGAFAMLIAFLYQGYDLEDSLDRVMTHLNNVEEARETLEALQKARRAQSVAELGEGWVAEEALAIAVFCALHHRKDFRKGVLAAVNITGDSDSTGAITGNILGLLNGEEGIPLNWRKQLREYALISRITDDLHTGCETDERGGVTDSWWEKYPGF
jgi:ADP-ribosylglycohydrolase